ncbi:MAG: hypothetical protein Q8J69_07685 [Sphingobacteriaceae bacterium]|nr:hypothetical protein [Sphingobacteriaceae bacterium]
MDQKTIIHNAIMAQSQATAQVAETYTGAWLTWRKLLAQENNLHMLADVVNTLLEVMQADKVNALTAAARKSIQLETDSGKLLVMAAACEILVGKFIPGQQITVNDLYSFEHE